MTPKGICEPEVTKNMLDLLDIIEGHRLAKFNEREKTEMKKLRDIAKYRNFTIPEADAIDAIWGGLLQKEKRLKERQEKRR